MSDAAPLIWFADDWGRHPSSSQHLVRRLLPNRTVHYVNTIGTRKPRLDLETIKRGFEKVRQWSQRHATGAASQPLPEHLSVTNPRMWPWFSHGWDRRINRELLGRHLRRLSANHNQPPIVVTTLPWTADLVDRVPARRWVYYCVDDFTVWPGLDGRALLKMERRLVEKVDRIVAVSETLRTRLASMGRPSELLTHGVDLEFWQTGEGSFPDFASHPKPWIVFWGVVDRRMDSAMIRALAEARLGTLLLVGPHNHPDPALAALPGVVLPGPLPLHRLPALAKQTSVLVMPYANLPVTRAIQPLKLKEYLATGLPCVVSDLPANRDWADCLDIVTSAADLVATVKRRLEHGIAPEQRLARGRLAHEGWAAKAQEFARFIDAP